MGRGFARWLCVCCWVLALLSLAAFGATVPAKVVVGIYPTYDQSGEDFSQAFTQHLTNMMFHELEASPVEPVLLNPGGMYTTVQDDFTTEYAQKNKIDVALITVLLKTEVPEKGQATLRVKADLLEMRSGKTLASWESTEQIKKRELFLEHGSLAYFVSSRPFAKQPLGKKAQKIAEDMRDQVTRAAASVTPSREPPAPPGVGSCKITFKVAYVTKHALSKSYDVVVNGEDQTLSIKDGTLPLTLQSGPLLIQLVVHDAPYKLPKQEIYQTNTMVDCSQNPRGLSFEIGGAGEGFLQWE